MARSYEERQQYTQSFREDRFGMFIHWGLYAIPARGEWVRSREETTIQDYEPFFEEFNPTHYDPKAWAKLAKEAGMRYAVLTTKHHDGFCLFDSAYTDYKATNTPAGRDLVREYVDAFRAEGIKVGFYYSLLDWHHPDYPHSGDRHHPMRNNPDCKNDCRDFSRYVTYLHNQVRELLTNYGKIDLLWFDFSYDDMTGERWEAAKLVDMIRSLQPGIIIDNRLGGDPKATDPVNYSGDYASPEQTIPLGPVTDEAGRQVPWESCLTLNDHWGYCSSDHNYKSAKTVIRTLTDCVSKGGNLLLNVGPNAKGEIPKESVEILREVGEWMYENGDSIYGCGASGLPKPSWGAWTQKGTMLYAHVMERGVGSLCLPGLRGKVKRARLLEDGSELMLHTPWMVDHDTNHIYLDFPSAGLPDERDTVLALELND